TRSTRDWSSDVCSSDLVNYRKLAFDYYPAVCAYCGYGIRDVLEVGHIDCNRSNNAITNLVILCPNCHKMHDLDLISTATIIHMRSEARRVRKAHEPWGC